MSNLQAEEYKSFEEIKKTKENGTEYWSARELSAVLQYKNMNYQDMQNSKMQDIWDLWWFNSRRYTYQKETKRK